MRIEQTKKKIIEALEGKKKKKYWNNWFCSVCNSENYNRNPNCTSCGLSKK